MVIMFWVIFINLTCSFRVCASVLSAESVVALRFLPLRLHIEALVLIPSTGFKENFLRFSGINHE